MQPEEASALLESAPDALVVIDAHGHITLVNHQTEALFGYRRDELVGQSVDVLVPIGLRPIHAAHRDVYARAPTPRPMGSGTQQRARRKDGSEFPAEVSLSPVQSASGPSVIATVRDLTEHRRVEAALHQSAITLESIGDAVIATDRQRRVALMNRRAEELTGWSAAEARGRPIDEVVTLFDERTGGRLSPTCIASEAGLDGPLLLRSRLGIERTISDSLARITDSVGDEHGLVLVFRDVTDARRAELSLRRSRRDLQEIVDKIPEGVLISDGLLVAFANPVLARWLGYAAGELAGSRLDTLVAPEDRPLLAATITPGPGDADAAAQVELRFLRKDGTLATLALTPMQAIEYEARPCYLSLAHDVSEQRALQAQLILADRMASIGMLAAGLAHEINNPLTSVIGNLDFAIAAARSPLVRGAGRLASQLLSDLLEARQAAMRIRDIVRDVKILSHANHDERGPVDVNRALEAAARIARVEFRHRAHIIEDYGDVPAVTANESRLGQVFLNLVVNAFQAVGTGSDHGEVRLRTRVDSGSHVVVEVADNGHGMTKEVLARIFTPFFTTKPVGVGTGLGLSISHAIVTALGGELTAESTPGSGSVFRVRLPIAKEDAPLVTSPTRDVPSAPRARVLIVDDEPSIGKVLQRFLAQHDVTTATSGRQALELVDTCPFDVVVCDVMMPEMTGVALHAALEVTHPELARHMIFMSGGATEHLLVPGTAAGELPRLDKPLDGAKLLTLIAERLRQVQTQRS